MSDAMGYAGLVLRLGAVCEALRTDRPYASKAAFDASAAISDLTARLAEAEGEVEALTANTESLLEILEVHKTRATAAEAALATVTAERDEALKTVRRLQLEGTGADWQQREGETQTALQAIGEEFGFLGGEPRVDGVRRVLTEQRAALATAVEVMKPFAEEADSILPHVENQERPRIELLLGASTAYFTVGDLRRVRDFIRDHGGVKP
jgi:chromosome segregation ATPase